MKEPLPESAYSKTQETSPTKMRGLLVDNSQHSQGMLSGISLAGRTSRSESVLDRFERPPLYESSLDTPISDTTIPNTRFQDSVTDMKHQYHFIMQGRPLEPAHDDDMSTILSKPVTVIKNLVINN